MGKSVPGSALRGFPHAILYHLLTLQGKNGGAHNSHCATLRTSRYHDGRLKSLGKVQRASLGTFKRAPTDVDVGAEPGVENSSGLLPPAAIEQLVEQIHTNSQGQSRRATGAAASNLDLYQVNCTYYDALGRNDRNYLLARAIQFFAPGIPQVYYVGLLAGENDIELLERTQVGRDINRHYYTPDEIDKQAQRPVVQRLFRLMHWRNVYPAFAGSFSLPNCNEHSFAARWANGETWAELAIDFVEETAQITFGTGVLYERFPLFED